MCGIIGLVSSAESLNVGAFEDALRILRPRGPDDEGLMAFNSATGVALPLAGRDTNSSLGYEAAAGIQGAGFDVLLGNRRLAIIDLSVGGHQPMSYGERYWITFNGEIYNYIELRAELKAKGYSIRSDSDTEVLLAAYACWGEEMLQRLVGMFALAILDTQEKKLFWPATASESNHFSIQPQAANSLFRPRSSPCSNSRMSAAGPIHRDLPII